MRRSLIIMFFLLTGLLGVGFWNLRNGAQESPYVTAPVRKGEIEEGQQIILALSDGAKTTNRSSVSNPFGMRGFGGH